MPEGILDFFELVWAEIQSLDSRESKKDILYTRTLHMYLDERDNRPRNFGEPKKGLEFPIKRSTFVLGIRAKTAVFQTCFKD